MIGKVHSIETMGTLDGPGIRLVVFFAGCPLRCKYCHNPDAWDLCSGNDITSDEIVERAKRYKPYFAHGGGITLSGGEPLMQPEFAAEILKGCKASGIHTCIDTSGGLLNDTIKDVLKYAGLVLLDIKHTDPKQYHELTGGDIKTHKAFIEHCKENQIPLWIRQVILPGINSDEAYIRSLLQYIKGANVQKIELLPYHTLGVHKWKALGLDYPLEGLEPPSDELMDKLNMLVAGYEQ